MINQQLHLCVLPMYPMIPRSDSSRALAGRSNVIQGSFLTGKPLFFASALAPRASTSLQARQTSSGPPRPILPTPPSTMAIQPRTGDAFALPANLTLKPTGSGQLLPEPVQKKMEAFFNTSFADVRVHVGNEASSIGALAFTHGSDLYFAPGQYNPQLTQGQRLLGHELTHVLQQRAGRVRNPLGLRIAVVQDPALEAEAERMGIRATTFQASVQAKKVGPGAPRGNAPAPWSPGLNSVVNARPAASSERSALRSAGAILPASRRRPSPVQANGAVQLMPGESGTGWLLENWAYIMTFGVLAWLFWVYVMMTKRKAPPRQVFEQLTATRQNEPILEQLTATRQNEPVLDNPTGTLALAGPVGLLPTVDRGPRMVDPDEVILLPPPAHMMRSMLEQRQYNPVSLSNELVMSFVVRRNPEQIRLFLGEFCMLSTTGNELVAYRQTISEPQKFMRRILLRVELMCELHTAVLNKCKSSQSLEAMETNVDLFCTFVVVHDMGTELKSVASRLKEAVSRMTRKQFKLTEKASGCIAAENSPLGRLICLLDVSERYAEEDAKTATRSPKPRKETVFEQRTRLKFEKQALKSSESKEEMLPIESTTTLGVTPLVVNTPTAIVNPIPQVGGYVQIANNTSGNFTVEVRVDWRKVHTSSSHGRKIASDPALRAFYEQAMTNGYYPSTDTGTSGVKKEPNLYIVKISYPDAQSSPLNVDNNISLIARDTDSGGPQNTLRLTFESAEKRHG